MVEQENEMRGKPTAVVVGEEGAGQQLVKPFQQHE